MIRARPTGPATGWQLILVGAILFLASAYFYQDPEWNGNSRLDLTRAIVEKGSFSIDAYQSQTSWETGDKAFFDGHYYSDKAIGSSLLALPFYFLVYRIAAALHLSLSSFFVKHVLTTIVLGSCFAGSGVAMYLIARKITNSSRRALIPTLGLSLGTMLWPYSAVFYGHVMAAAFLVVAFYILFSMDEEPGSISVGRTFWPGLLMGLAFITEFTAALIVAGLIAYAVHVLRKERVSAILRTGLVGSLGALIPISIMLAYNAMVYRSPWATGYAYEAENKFLQGMSAGVMGITAPSLSTIYHITIDPQFGLLWQSPILLLAPIGYVIALRSTRYRAAGLLCLYAVAVMLAMNGGYYLWWGGSAFGPRLLIPALPFFIVPLALLPEALGDLTGLLAVVSGAQMLIPLVGQIQVTRLTWRLHRDMFYVAGQPFTGVSLLYNYGVPQIIRQYQAGMPSWMLGAALGIPYWLSLPTLVAAEAALTVRFRWLAHAERIRGLQQASPTPPATGRDKP